MEINSTVSVLADASPLADDMFYMIKCVKILESTQSIINQVFLKLSYYRLPSSCGKHMQFFAGIARDTGPTTLALPLALSQLHIYILYLIDELYTRSCPADHLAIETGLGTNGQFIPDVTSSATACGCLWCIALRAVTLTQSILSDDASTTLGM